jgi:ACS family glucarate transporter-like MFS transporter
MFLNWLPTYLVQGRGFSMIKMGIYGALPWASMLIFMYVGGFLSDILVKRGIASVLSRRICIYTGLLIMTFGLLLITRATNGYAAVYCISLAMLGFGLTIPSYFAIPLDMGGKEQAGKMTGIINTFSAAAAILAPFITGSLVSVFSWSTALYVAVAAPVIAIVLVFISVPKHDKSFQNVIGV